MSENKYAELKLYFGYVPGSLLREGVFVNPPPNDYLKEAYFRAMNYVQRRLIPGYLESVNLGFEKLVKTPQDAEELIEYAEDNIEGASRRIELVDYMHGMIRFYRKIHFEGWCENRKDELVGLLKKSEIKPEINRWWIEGLTDLKHKEQAEDKAWNAGLKFYPKKE